MAKWILKRTSADFKNIAKSRGIDPLFALVLANRGIIADEDYNNYINGNINYDETLLEDMELLTDIVREKISEEKHIRIVGDYDVDGVAATAILKKGIEAYAEIAGYSSFVDTRIPHRMKDGYGLNAGIIKEAFDAGIDTLLTCDNGISAIDEIAEAKRLGMTVLVTDHHEIPFDIVNDVKIYKYPEADAIVDPKREDSLYPFKEICGAYLAYKVIYNLLKEYDSKELLMELGEIAAIATVADIMELTNENRQLVREGLKSLKNPKNIGLSALTNQLGLKDKELMAFNIAFMIGPSINAAGRLKSADIALSLLLENDKAKVESIAEELIGLNIERKRIQDEAVEKASQIIEKNAVLDKVLVIYIPGIHESVAGIVAGKLKEKYSRPCLMITDSLEAGIVKGSARSIEAYHMYDALNSVSDIFIKFGGHAMAAGFSLPSSRVEELRDRLNANCDLQEEDFKTILKIDADVPFAYISPTLVDQLALLEPTGAGNEKCYFARKNVEIVSAVFFGDSKNVGRYRVKDSDNRISELTLFRKNEELQKYLSEKYGEQKVKDAYAGKDSVQFSVAYYPRWNEYAGRKSIQLIIEDFC